MTGEGERRWSCPATLAPIPVLVDVVVVVGCGSSTGGDVVSWNVRALREWKQQLGMCCAACRTAAVVLCMGPHSPLMYVWWQYILHEQAQEQRTPSCVPPSLTLMHVLAASTNYAPTSSSCNWSQQ